MRFYRHIAAQSLTVVDVETTGSIPSHSRITEISVLQATLEQGIEVQQTHLMNPRTRIPERIVQVTGISQSMVDVAPPASDVLPDYLLLLSEGILTAHNLEFDYSFLRTEFTRLGLAFVRPDHEQFCTVQLARLMLPDLPSRSLPYLVKHFQFEVDTSHRAEADTRACWFLAKRLLTEILSEDDATLLERFARQWIPLKVAAHLLGCSRKVCQSRLESAGITSRLVGYGKRETLMYQRGDVERVIYERQDSSQLSIL